MNYPRRLTRRARRLICLALAVMALTSWVALRIPGMAPASARVQGGVTLDKEQMLARLNELDATITNLRQQLALNRKDKNLQAQLDAASREYDSLSAQMGGDRAAPGGNPDDQLLDPVPNVAPPAPPGCMAATTTATQSTPVAIPAGPAVVTSTLVVAGAGPYLLDLDLTTTLTHTFAADLDITIQSPAGTVVTLTTDNGAGNDNVFNGTLWDDDANPAGQVPYTTNAGVATDHPYANNVLASPLVPEETFGAFVGEDPNGTWTITISDDLAGDGGSLANWTLNLTTLSAAPTAAMAAFMNTTPVAIPAGPAVVTSTLVVAGAGPYLLDLDLTTTLTHTFAADLDITIQSPAGTVVTLTTDNGAGNDNVFNGTLWDDDANPAGQVPYVTNAGLVTDHPYANNVLASPLVPEETFGAFIGEDPNGTWTITISDDTAGEGGSLNSWTLNITTATCAVACTLTCPANITVSNDPNQCGAVVNYPAPTTTGTCGTVTCSPPSGSFFPVGATTVTCTETGGASCSFTITVNDTQPPTITCPTNVTAVTPAPGQTCTVVTFPPPTASDNCPGVTTACNPPSGSCFPIGTTTVTCTATDASGNTATCSFTVTTFDACLQDDSNPANVLLFNTTTGEYRFCCGGTVFTGIGKVSNLRGSVTLSHATADRRVLAKLETSQRKGTASLQSPPGTTRCTINDRDTRDNTCACGP